MTITIDTRQRGQDVGRGVGDERGVVIGEQHPVALNKVEQVRHLLKVRGNVGVVTREMGVVELDVNYMLNIAFCRVELATTRGISNAALVSKRQSHQCQKHRQERCYNKYTSKVVPPESFYLVHNSSSVSNLQWSLKH